MSKQVGLISIEKLRKVKHLIVHENCSDGTASAMLLHDVLPNADVQFVQYNTQKQQDLPAVEGMLFADFSPPISRVQEFLDVGAIVLDHHGGPVETVTKLFVEQGLGAYAHEKEQTGVSGALLTYEHVWAPLANIDCADEGASFLEKYHYFREFATLIGIRDTWQTKSPKWESACDLDRALLFWPWEHIKSTSWTDWKKALFDIGPVLRYQNDIKIKKCIEGGYSFSTRRGTRVLLFQGHKESSDVSEAAKDYDLVIGSSFFTESNQPQVLFSCRTRKEYNCRAFAMAHGGNGHLKAARCNRKIQPNDPNTFALIENLLNDYESLEQDWLDIINEEGFGEKVAAGTIVPQVLYQTLKKI